MADNWARNNNIAQPEDDLVSSTSNVDIPQSLSNTAPFPGVAEADLASSTRSERENGFVEGSAAHPDNQAEAFYGGRVYRQPQVRGEPTVEMPALLDNRPLHEVHLGIVSATASKRLLEGLKNSTQLTAAELAEINKPSLRKVAVNTLLNLWNVKEPNRTVSDLVQLLERAGEPNNAFAEIIARVRLCVP